MVEHLENATVSLMDFDQESETYYTFCAGVWISPHRIATAKHCAEAQIPTTRIFGIELPGSKLEGTVIKFVSKKELDGGQIVIKESMHKAVVSHVDENSDLVILTTNEDLDHPIIKIFSENIWKGMPVHIMGHTAGFEYTYMNGLVSGEIVLERRGQIERMLHLTALIYKGNSGGGAFSSNGELVGICSAMSTRVAGMSYFVHRDTIAQLIQDNNIDLSY